MTLDDDVLETARSLASQRGLPLGAVVSELARRGLTTSTPAATRNGFPLFPVRIGAAPVTPEIVKALLEESD